jgi:predicted hydrolase (HD superfamily)
MLLMSYLALYMQQHLFVLHDMKGLEVKSVLKRLKSPAFAAQVSREDINDAISRINTSLEEIIQFIIDHQKDVN